MNKRRAFAVPAVLLLVAGMGAASTLLVPNWRPWNWGKPAAPTPALVKAEADLAAARAESAAKDAKYQQALREEHERVAGALGYAQQMATGAVLAQQQAKPDAAGELAASLTERAANGLETALGPLPTDKRAEIADIVRAALSAKQAEVDRAQAALAAKDADLQRLGQEKRAIEAQLPGLQAQAQAAQSKAQAAEGLVQAKTQEVVAYADRLAAKERETGGLGAQLENYGRLLVILGLVYFAIHFVFPLLAQSYPGAGWLAAVANFFKNLTTAHL